MAKWNTRPPGTFNQWWTDALLLLGQRARIGILETEILESGIKSRPIAEGIADRFRWFRRCLREYPLAQGAWVEREWRIVTRVEMVPSREGARYEIRVSLRPIPARSNMELLAAALDSPVEPVRKRK